MSSPPTTYVLTGSNRGLGLEFVRQLSVSASNTIFAGVRSLSADLSDLHSLVSASKATIHVLACDSSSPDSIAAFATDISKTLGTGGKVDFLLNNAGINQDPNVPVLSWSTGKEGEEGKGGSTPTVLSKSLYKHMEVNVLAPLMLASALEPLLKKGSVVMNMTSGLGSLGIAANSKPTKCPVYSISKAALNMGSLHLKEELERKGKGVRVAVVDPGWVKTRMVSVTVLFCVLFGSNKRWSNKWLMLGY